MNNVPLSKQLLLSFHLDIKKSQNLLGVTKHGTGLGNHLPSKKQMNHIRHSSAPSQRTFERKSRDADENNNFLLQEKRYLKENADRTFEHFIRTGAPSAPKVVSDDFGTVNDISKSKGTQTFEGPFESHDEYFKSRESKRINANAKRAQKVYYETYLKELKNEESKGIVPHPPAIRPSIKKPVNTSRINRLDIALISSRRNLVDKRPLVFQSFYFLEKCCKSLDLRFILNVFSL